MAQGRMRNLTMTSALNTALREEMRRDESVIVMGEDIGVYGGVYGVTLGLQKTFGTDRVRDTPISEMAIAGMAVGGALGGLRPVVEIMYCDFLAHAADAIVNNAAKWRYMGGGQYSLPLVVRSPGGGGGGTAAQHSQSLEAWFTHIPGLKVVAPSVPRDARGLLKAAIRDDNPVVFIEHKNHYNYKGEVPAEEEIIPLGVADVKREGADLTVVSWSRHLTLCLEVAETLAAEGLSLEVVDPRTLQPLDMATIAGSVAKTGRLAVVHEAVLFGGFGGEIVAQVVAECWGDLKQAPLRIGAPFCPVPYSEPLESFVIPSAAAITDRLREYLA